jgi:sugar phosphate isomerase/epimerase
MEPHLPKISRRRFAKSLAVAGATLSFGSALTSTAQETSAAPRKIKLGLDNFAVRAMKWKADQLIQYAASVKADSLFITDFGPFESFEDGYLKDLRKKAADQGIDLWLGSWSICPTSKTFKKDWGTAEEHLRLGLRLARALGSPAFRVILGSREDRRTPGGIEARIQDTIKVCKACRSEALDANVKIAVENHAGDMQAWELVTLVEEAGKDYVGVNLDSGNATWTLEDPLASLELLGPYAACTSLRDSMIWPSPDGAKIQWTAMGEGVIDWKTYFTRFATLCPGVPVHIETISGFALDFPYLKREFWQAFPKARAADLAQFLALVRHGKPIDPYRAPDSKAEQEYQKGELERSLTFCRDVIGLGTKA